MLLTVMWHLYLYMWIKMSSVYCIIKPSLCMYRCIPTSDPVFYYSPPFSLQCVLDMYQILFGLFFSRYFIFLVRKFWPLPSLLGCVLDVYQILFWLFLIQYFLYFWSVNSDFFIRIFVPYNIGVFPRSICVSV